MSLFKDISELFAPTIDGLGNEAIVKAAYQDLLGYSDADTMDNAQARIDYWVGELNSGLSTANFGEQFLSEAETSQGSLITTTTFENNKTVVQAHRDEIEANPDATIAELKTVASTNRVDDVVSESDSGTPGETFTLTTATDVEEGASDDDKFIGTDATYNTGDSIDGKAGTDSLNLTFANANTALADIQNVEQVYVRDVQGVTVNAAGWDAVDQVWSDRSTQSTTISNVGNLVTAGIKEGDGANNYTITYDTAVVSGADDTQNVRLDSADAGTLLVDGVETMSVSTIGDSASSVTLDSDSLETLNVSGAQDAALTVATDADDNLATVDAGDMTGALTLTIAATPQDIAITGGGADDRFVLSTAGELGADDTVNGGEGTDTLSLVASTGTVGFDATSSVTNIETLEIQSVIDTDAVDLDNINVDTVNYVNTDDGDDLSVTNATDETIEIDTGDAAGSDVVGSVTVALADASGSDDSASFIVRNNLDGTTGAITDLIADDIETVNIEATFDEEITTEANQVLTIGGIQADAAERINFTGDAALTVTLEDAVADQVISAADMTGSVDLTAEQTVDYTITGSDGGDTFTMTSAMNGDDTVDGGAGDDTLEAAVDSTGGSATLVLATTTNVETVDVTVTQDADEGGETATIDATNVSGGTVLIDGTLSDAGNTDTTAITNLSADTAVTVDGDYTNGNAGNDYLITAALADASGSSDSLTVNLTQTDNSDQTLDSFEVEDVESVTLAVTPDDDNANIDTVTVSTLNIDDATSLTVSSEEDLVLNVDESDALETIDLSEAVEDVTLSLDGSDDTGVEIQLGNPSAAAIDVSITLDSDEGASDTIKFADSEVGDIAIANFTDGSSVVADILDFSALGITALSDLTITETGGTTTLINADEFDGEIELTGVTNAQLDTANFDFA